MQLNKLIVFIWVYIFSQFIFSPYSLAENLNAESFSYYGPQFFENAKELSKTQQLKNQLFIILSSAHTKRPNQPDMISPLCSTQANCISHTLHSYKEARHFLFGFLYLEKDSEGSYIKEAYCELKVRNSMLDPKKPMGPEKIPDPGVINTEHTWPQSRFSGAFSKRLQQADLHALFPTLSKVNNLRSHLDFYEVDHIQSQLCEASKKGRSLYIDGTFFEPPDDHKGNVARALFYFSVRYRLSIRDEIERVLRKWHAQDTVDTQEKERHEHIFQFQKVRNPFIDHEWLVEYIKDF